MDLGWLWKHFCCFIYFIYLTECVKHQEICNGGWETDDSKMLATPGPCNIDVVDVSIHSFSQQLFEDNYAYEKPVIIKGSTDNTKFRKLCEKSALLDRYGDKIVRLSSANTHSYSKRDVKLKKYVNEIMKPQTLDTLGNETFYWFGDNDHEEFAELFDEYKAPPYRLPNMYGVYSFGLAAAGTGVPFHFHGPGFGEVVFGRKRWFMYPPDKQPAFNPNKTTLHWLLEEYDNLHPDDKPLECTISEGEIIYFPDRWWHGTLNIDTSVFISTFLG
ncbi:jmjC domain-containing protein 8-like isoform X2 [Mercenaria mercenaria]|uniref:jmjC domain-containing protein 8-like isoform X2 n=1 Tax=Mercenaria mercenaria TaxID=6596 RepID=UPI001E1DDDF3|nr:jmjC domain-containing protein 8-like isoform X2 [Mercenaria mercenaria]